MHNKLIVNHAQIFTPALHDLYAAQKILDDKESQRQELNQQVHLLAKKLHNLSRLREKNCITAAQYWERRNPLERELTDVKTRFQKQLPTILYFVPLHRQNSLQNIIPI